MNNPHSAECCSEEPARRVRITFVCSDFLGEVSTTVDAEKVPATIEKLENVIAVELLEEGE
jgi:hypothetical protein